MTDGEAPKATEEQKQAYQTILGNEATAKVWKDIAATMTRLGRKPESAPAIVQEIIEVSKQPFVERFKAKGEIEVLRQAAMVVLMKMKQGESGAPTNLYEITVLDPVEAGPWAKRDGSKSGTLANVWGIGQMLEEGKENPRKLVKLVFFGKDGEESKLNARTSFAKFGKTYHVWAAVNKKGKGTKGYNLTATSKTHFEKEVPTNGFDPIAELQRLFPRVDIKFADNHLSKEDMDDLDALRLVQGRVIQPSVGFSEVTGRDYGRYTIYDDSMSAEDAEGARPFSVFTKATQVRFDGGSALWFLGRITTKESWGAGMSAEAVFPAEAEGVQVPYTPEITPRPAPSVVPKSSQTTPLVPANAPGATKPKTTDFGPGWG